MFRRAGGLALLGVVAGGLAAAGLRLDRADRAAPLDGGGDALLVLPMAREAVERGHHWVTPRLGAPGVQHLHDFPVVDHLHLLIVGALGRAVGPVEAFNLYHLLTYPLAAVAAGWAFGRLGLSAAAAGGMGLLYAFLPYHPMRGEAHYFLSAYYVVPLTLWLALGLPAGRLPPFGPRRQTLAAVGVAVLTASAGAYYAFFGCALIAAAGLTAWPRWGWRGPAAAAAVAGAVTLFGALNHAPALLYQLEHGANAAPRERFPEEAEEYGLKLAHLLLPARNHHSPALDRLAAAYDTPQRPLQTENRTAALGLVGAVGFVVLMGVCLLPARTGPLGPPATLALAGVLLATVGGFGAVGNLLVSPQVRAYCRVSVFLGFLALFAAGWLLDRATVGRPVWVRGVVAAGLTAFGLWDQTPADWFGPAAVAAREAAARDWRTDAGFFAAAEERFPGGMVFCLPFVAYPETLSAGRLSGYHHARGFLHTRTVRWSYGAVRGREADAWQRSVAGRPPAALLDALVVKGFDGLFLDARGFDRPADAAAVLAGVRPLLGPPAVHPDGEQFLFDLRPHRDRLRAEPGGRFDALVRADAEAVRVLWLDGFVSFEPPGREDRHRWCKTAGTLVLFNPLDRPRPARVRCVLRTATDAPARLDIAGPAVGWAEHLYIDRHRPLVERDLVLPPGRSEVRFRCRPPADFRPTDSRRLVFFVAEWELADRRPDAP